VAEEHGSGQLHLHALLWGTSTLDSDYVRGAWPHGRSHVDVFDPQRGATYYFTKTIGSHRDDYDYSLPRPPLREETLPRSAPEDMSSFRKSSISHSISY
jgi:hypothetical protein